MQGGIATCWLRSSGMSSMSPSRSRRPCANALRSGARPSWRNCGTGHRELHGYPDEAPLPDYRKIRTPLLMDGFTGAGIFRGRQTSVIDLPEETRGVVGDELPVTFGAGKIEALIRQAEARGGTIDLGPAAAAELALMTTHEIGRYQVERVYWSAGTGVLCGVIDAIRTTLTELVAEIRAGGRPGGGRTLAGGSRAGCPVRRVREGEPGHVRRGRPGRYRDHIARQRGAGGIQVLDVAPRGSDHRRAGNDRRCRRRDTGTPPILTLRRGPSGTAR